jgi:hypothetical protein
MTARAFEMDAERSRRGDRRHDADGNAGSFEQRPLLDVQFHKRRIVVVGEFHSRQIAAKTGRLADVIEPLIFAVAQLAEVVGLEAAAKRPAADATDAEARRLLAREHQEFNRAARSKARRLQRADRFESAEHADGAVVSPRVRNGVGVRAGGDRGQGRFAAGPAGEKIADGVVAEDESSGGAVRFRKRSSPQVGGGIKHARDGRRLGITEGRELFQLTHQTVDFDLDLQTAHDGLLNGCRLTSL